MPISNQVITNTSNINELKSVDDNTFRVLQETLYPGATDDEVSMILSYCRAKRIDPILKPVHLVPMNVKTDKKDASGKWIYKTKKVIMPGIGSYRIDASRSGQYAGMTEPEFGEEITESFTMEKGQSKSVTYPKWCKITVKKMMQNGTIVDFTAKEYWKENYASKSKWDTCPNDMWEKRAYGQLSKCTEAQVLRKAFPDSVGNEYTREEMEGKNYSQDSESNPKLVNKNIKIVEVEKVIDELDVEFADSINAIEMSDTEDKLKSVFEIIKKMNFKTRPDLFKALIDAKDKRKGELTVKEFNNEIDNATGEVIS